MGRCKCKYARFAVGESGFSLMAARGEQELGPEAAESAPLLRCSQRPSAFRARLVYLLRDFSFNRKWGGGAESHTLCVIICFADTVSEGLMIFCSVSGRASAVKHFSNLDFYREF